MRCAAAAKLEGGAIVKRSLEIQTKNNKQVENKGCVAHHLPKCGKTTSLHGVCSQPPWYTGESSGSFKQELRSNG